MAFEKHKPKANDPENVPISFEGDDADNNAGQQQQQAAEQQADEGGGNLAECKPHAHFIFWLSGNGWCEIFQVVQALRAEGIFVHVSVTHTKQWSLFRYIGCPSEHKLESDLDPNPHCTGKANGKPFSKADLYMLALLWLLSGSSM